MLPLGSSKSVLEHVVRRALDNQFRLYVFTSDLTEDDVIERGASDLGIPVFRGSLRNKLNRWQEGLTYFGLDRVHLLDVDDPFFSSERVRTSTLVHSQRQIDVLLPSSASDLGEASEGTSVLRSAIKDAEVAATAAGFVDTDVIPWHALLGDGRVQTLESPVDHPRFRLTLDYLEDYELMNHLAGLFGPTVPREDLEDYLDRNPSLVKINQFRSKDFLAAKANFLSSNFTPLSHDK